MTTKVKLPVLPDEASSLARDGHRNFVQPADVSGRFTRRRYVVFAVLIVVYVLLPFIQIGGHPAVFLDVVHRRFHLFGQSFNATDFWLVFFLLSGIGFALILVTTLFGRFWCGYACPQTVFLEGIFRRIERAIEGPRNERIRRNAAPLSFEKAARKTLKHVIFAALCIALGHVFLSYFVSLPSLVAMVQSSPREHPEAFAWLTAFAAVTYFDFAWFREQLCLIICPYGRLQSALADADTTVIAYDTQRGEPRGAKGTTGAGDCVDCKRCVVVCPTGIDIRNGLQIDCIGCAACVDACDEVMVKLSREPGLVRYDSLRGLAGGKRKLLRPRVILYAVLGVVGVVVATVAASSRVPFEAHLIRMGGAGFVVSGDESLNPVRLQIVNKSGDPMVITTRSVSSEGVRVEPPVSTTRLTPGQSHMVSFLVRAPLSLLRDPLETRIEVSAEGHPDDRVVVRLPVAGPLR